MQEKVIEEIKQGTSLVQEQKEGNQKKLFIESYGCQMNFSDSEISTNVKTSDFPNAKTNGMPNTTLIPQMLLEKLPCREVGGETLILHWEHERDAPKFEAGRDSLSPVPEFVDHLGSLRFG
jgi:hypothetical protein